MRHTTPAPLAPAPLAPAPRSCPARASRSRKSAQRVLLLPQTPQWNSISGAFGEINIDGPGIGQPTQELGLKFKFVNRATNQPVEISWMQFSIFDLDQAANGNGREVSDPFSLPIPRRAPDRCA